MAASAASFDEQRYPRRECVAFRKTGDPFGGLSNMAPGFPVRVAETPIKTAEALYQACRFPHEPDLQRMIIEQPSPMTAKMKTKPFRSRTRADWADVRVDVMRWCLRVKLADNWSRFGELLDSTGDRMIVEESPRDRFWGAGYEEDRDAFVGGNALGRLLMELRAELRQSGVALRLVDAPLIPDLLLLERPIDRITPDREGANEAMRLFDLREML